MGELFSRRRPTATRCATCSTHWPSSPPGAGSSRGGYGVVRDYQVLEEGTVLKYSNENTRNVLSSGVDG